MPPYRLFKHHEYDRSANRLPNAIQNKALWAQVLLGIRGRTPTVKGVKGYNERWRRTPVQGNHFYLWWIPRSESTQIAGWRNGTDSDNNSLLVNSIRHHDATDEPIDLGDPDDYQEVLLPSLDPRFEEQIDVSQRVNRETVALATLKGLPDSGKTISLLYLVKDLAERGDLRKILYVTYTQSLKRMAKELFEAQGDAINRRISLRTLGELEGEIAGTQVRGEPFSELEDFTRFLDAQNQSTLGQWRKFPATFYTELRAHLLGRSFPDKYKVGDSGGKFDAVFHRAILQNPALYAKDRDLDPQLSAIALRMLDRMQGRFFGDQRTAQRALQLAAQDKLPRWLSEIDGLIVDEVQDLTLLQLALLGEVGRSRLRKDEYSPFSFIVAGDESQIVQPSGFDWGTAKDLLGEQIGIYPDEFEFEHQRRAPRNLAHLIDATWNLYLRLPKQLRPSAKRQSFIYEEVSDSTGDEEVGRILICPLPEAKEAGERWSELLVELGDKPGRAVVDLSEGLIKGLKIPSETSSGEPSNSDLGEETIFLAREIKGLERSTVLIHGLNDVYMRAHRLIDNHDGQQLAFFEARRIFDEVRVALSRSTDRIVILDSPSAPVFAELAIDQLEGVFAISWGDLLDLLRNEEMSDVEVIEGILEEADELVERGRWEQAYRQNRRAYDLALQIGDLALQREAQQEFIRTHLYEANHWLGVNDWSKADAINQRAQQLAAEYGDPFLTEEVEDQRREIDSSLTYQAQNHLTAASESKRQKQYKRAFNSIQAALSTVNASDDPSLQVQVDELLVEIAVDWANVLVEAGGPAAQLAELYDAAAQAMERQHDRHGAEALAILAQRYNEVPEIGDLSPADITSVLAFLRRYMAAVSSIKPAEAAYTTVQAWVEECFACLGNHLPSFVEWAIAAIEFEQATDYAELDNHLWELELRVEELSTGTLSAQDEKAATYFRAIVAAFTGDPAEASLAWEQLGEIPLAVEQARVAGDVERAYNLLRQSKGDIPEELSTAVKALRLLQQLEQKHHGLSQAERKTILEALARLHTLLSVEEEQS